MSQSVNTKDKLISAAIKVFSEKGFFNAKVSDIVKQAGVAQGTFYIYFKSKEDIFFEIVELVERQLDEVINRYKTIKADIKELIFSFSEEIFRILNEYREVAYIFFFQLLCMEENIREKYINTHKKFINFYEEILSGYNNSSIIAAIIVGFGEKLFKFDYLIEGKDIQEVILEFKTGVDIILRGL